MATPATPQPGKLDVASMLASIPTGSGTGTQDYIGLPSNTADPSQLMALDQAAQGAWAQGQRAAAYGIGSDMMPVYQSWTPSDIDNLQRRMVAAGLLDQDYRSGVWDDASSKAFTSVLGLANNMGQPWQNAMAQYETGTPMMWDAKTGTFVQGKKGTARTNSAVSIRFTNPDDLATAANGVAQAKLGRSFTPDELQRFVRAYHDTEASTATSANAASGIGGGGYTEAPSVQTAAENFAKQTDPTAYNAESFLPLVQKMNDMLNTNPYNTTKPMEV